MLLILWSGKNRTKSANNELKNKKERENKMSKETKGEMLVRQGAERRARAKNEPPKKPVEMLISKDRGILVEPTLARKDPALRKAQLDEKAAEEGRRLAKIEKAKKFNADVIRKKLEAEKNRRDAETKEEAIVEEEAKALEEAKIPNTATPAAQKLADEHGILISELEAGADNRIQLSEVKAAIKAISGE